MTDLTQLRAEIATTTKRLRELRRKLREAKGAAPPKARVRIRQRPKGGTWKADRDECDVLYARIVKVERGGRCEGCGATKRVALQWCHIFSRKYLSTRYAPDNCLVLCAAEHVRWTYDPAGWEVYIRHRIGDAEYDKLRMRALLPTRFDPRIVMGLRARAAELGVLDDAGWRSWQEAA